MTPEERAAIEAQLVRTIKDMWEAKERYGSICEGWGEECLRLKRLLEQR